MKVLKASDKYTSRWRMDCGMNFIPKSKSSGHLTFLQRHTKHCSSCVTHTTLGVGAQLCPHNSSHAGPTCEGRPVWLGCPVDDRSQLERPWERAPGSCSGKHSETLRHTQAGQPQGPLTDRPLQDGGQPGDTKLEG